MNNIYNFLDFNLKCIILAMKFEFPIFQLRELNQT